VASAERPTVLSVRSTFLTLGGAMGLVALGLVAERASIPASIAVAAGVFALAAPGTLVLGRGDRGRTAAEAAVPAAGG
jgi:hypothetical protein